MQYANGLNFDNTYSRMYSACMSIGDRLDEAMKAAKFESQSALQRASGVPQATISRILKGDGKKGPETDTVRKLAAACNVTFEWLLEGANKAAQANRATETRPQAVTVSTAVTADEILELLEHFKLAGPNDRAMIIKSAKLAARRVRQSIGSGTAN